MSDIAYPAEATILTMSFRGDHELCAALCRSIDRFADGSIKHLVYVPASDLPLFQPLARHNRDIIAEDVLLPRWLAKLPMPRPPLRRLLRLPRRDIYVSPFSLPVRGWIVQQIMKIAAACAAPTEVMLHTDSDALFVRPFSAQHLFSAPDLARLYRQPPVQTATHRAWHLAASRLLGLPADEFHDGDYIDSMVVWRRSVVDAMIRHLESVTGRDWRLALARTPHFSEYDLYGIFAERVRGLVDARLQVASASLCLTRWTDDFASDADKMNFVASLQPDMIGFCVQSTLGLSTNERERMHDRMIAQGAHGRRPA